MKRSTIVVLVAAGALLLAGCERERLAEAVSAGDAAEVKRLLAAGVYPDLSDADGRTPLHLACERGDSGIATLLLDHGARLSAQDREGSTPLHLAAAHGHAAVAQLLLARGADHSARDHQGRTPLQLAAQANHRQVAALLYRAAPVRSAPTPTLTPPRVVSRPAPQRTSGG